MLIFTASAKLFRYRNHDRNAGASLRVGMWSRISRPLIINVLVAGRLKATVVSCVVSCWSSLRRRGPESSSVQSRTWSPTAHRRIMRARLNARG